MTAPRRLRVAAWQCAPRPLDVAGNLRRLGSAAARAAAAGVDVLVTPEMFLSGYAVPPAELRRLAQPADGDLLEAVSAISQRTGVAVCYGFPELGAGGEVFNAAQLVDGDAVLGRHRKAHLFGALDRVRFSAAPEASATAELRGWSAALLICYDVEFPEAVRAAALAGAEVVLVPTANMAGYEIVPTVLVRARAYENGCFLAYANYCGSEPGIDYGGLSTICSPTGAVVALAGTAEELVIAELSSDIPALPPYLTDRRPELFDR